MASPATAVVARSGEAIGPEGRLVRKISWPTNFAGFNLETCTGLPPAGVWQTVAGPYPLSNGCFGLSVPTANGRQQFFRLHKPLP